MNPPVTWTIVDSIPSALHLNNKKRGHCTIKAGPDLLRLVKLLGLDKSYVRGREQFDRIFLKANQVNT